MFSTINQWIEALRETSKQSGVCVLVEGKRDFIRLSSFGIENIYTLKGKRFYDVVEEILENCERCIILFDTDKHGQKMTEKFSSLLSAEGIQVDLSFREFLKNFGQIEIENIQFLE